ncbi:MAG: hypothetical protein U0R44_02390 [Candidatus Micrarchaeia archaeon]
MLLVWGLVSIILGLIGIAAGTDAMATVIGVVISLAPGFAGLIVFAIAMSIFGFITAVVYNIILGVGGGIDLDLRERS